MQNVVSFGDYRFDIESGRLGYPPAPIFFACPEPASTSRLDRLECARISQVSIGQSRLAPRSGAKPTLVRARRSEAPPR
jgi:hypothetical protein